MDIGGDPGTIERMQQSIEGVRDGTLEEFTDAGNAFYIKVAKNQIVISFIYVEEAEVAVYTPEQVLECLRIWKEFRLGGGGR